MSGRHSFNKLKDSMSAQSQEQIRKKLKQLRKEMVLAEVRKVMSLKQVNLTEMLPLEISLYA